MNKLREAIQSLCQSTNPLARSMDYIQEDLDNMGKELRFWTDDKALQVCACVCVSMRMLCVFVSMRMHVCMCEYANACVYV